MKRREELKGGVGGLKSKRQVSLKFVLSVARIESPLWAISRSVCFSSAFGAQTRFLTTHACVRDARKEGSQGGRTCTTNRASEHDQKQRELLPSGCAGPAGLRTEGGRTRQYATFLTKADRSKGPISGSRGPIFLGISPGRSPAAPVYFTSIKWGFN
jgi:hypothetical protein